MKKPSLVLILSVITLAAILLLLTGCDPSHSNGADPDKLSVTIGGGQRDPLNKGPQGPRGDQGTPGPIGPAGPVGEHGKMGIAPITDVSSYTEEELLRSSDDGKTLVLTYVAGAQDIMSVQGRENMRLYTVVVRTTTETLVINITVPSSLSGIRFVAR